MTILYFFIVTYVLDSLIKYFLIKDIMKYSNVFDNIITIFVPSIFLRFI